MRQIQLLKKAHVEDVKVGSIFPTNLIAYDTKLFVDDDNRNASVIEINLEKNSRSVGFEDDFADFVTYGEKLEYIAWSGGRDAKFLKEWYSKFGLSNVKLRVVHSKIADPFEYVGKIEIKGDSIRFANKQS